MSLCCLVDPATSISWCKCHSVSTTVHRSNRCGSPKRGQKPQCHFQGGGVFVFLLLKRTGHTQKKQKKSTTISKWPCRSRKKTWLIKTRSTSEANTRTWRNKKKKNNNLISIFHSLYTVWGCLSLCSDKERFCFRLMACLQCSMESAQMLCAGKMTLLTSSVSFLSTGETPGPQFYLQTPTEQYHADENLPPPNLINVSPVIFLLKLAVLLPPLPSVLSVASEQRAMISSAISKGYRDILSNSLVISLH